MGLFSPKFDERVQPGVTITGAQQTVSENVGSGLERRVRFFVHCTRMLADLESASPDSRGIPLTGGNGLDEAVNILELEFEEERSLIRWVALRGALTFLHMYTIEPGELAIPFTPEIEMAMGIDSGAQGWPDAPIDVADPWKDRLTPDQRENAIGLVSTVATKAFRYPEISTLSLQDVDTHPLTAGVNEAVGLDIIAWVAIALLRTGLANAMLDAPEPDALTLSGWYVEPVFAKAERYWDGNDWTDRCRIRDGRNYRESTVSL